MDGPTVYAGQIGNPTWARVLFTPQNPEKSGVYSVPAQMGWPFSRSTFVSPLV